MSPRYLGGSYRSRLHPGRKNARVSFCGRLSVWNRTASALSASRGDNEVDHAVCLKAECQMHTVLSSKNGKFYATMIYPCFSRSVCFSMGSPAWWRFGLCSSGSSLVFRWRGAPLVCEFQMWRRRCKQIDPHWFQGIKFVSSDYVQPYPRYVSWYIGSDCLVQQFFNHSPPASYFQQFTGSCYSLWVTGCDIEISLDMLWIGVDCIFKKRIFSMFWSISFLNYKYLI